MSQQEYIKELILKSLVSDLNEADQAQLDIWLQKSELNQNRYDRLLEDFSTGELPNNWEAIDLKQNWEMVLAKAESKEKPWFPLKVALRFAVAASVLLALFLWVYLSESKTVIANDTLAVLSYTLPDQSTIWLKPGASLEFEEASFSSGRDLSLNGEAFFEVQKGTIPFIVSTNKNSIEVLGTTFNINTNAQSTEVLLVEGSVKFSSEHNESILIPGELAISDGDKIKTYHEDFSLNRIGWKTGKFEFVKTPLNLVMEQIKPYYGIDVSIDSDAGNLLVTTSFDNQSLDEVIQELSFILNIEIERTNRTLTIN